MSEAKVSLFRLCINHIDILSAEAARRIKIGERISPLSKVPN